MRMRIGKVTQVFPSTGKMKVLYEDENNASLQLSMLTMNNEYSMPKVGDRVLTMHMENGSSKGFVLGTYYGGGTQPKANSGYRKDYGGGAYATVKSGGYKLSAGSIELVVGDSDALQSIVLRRRNLREHSETVRADRGSTRIAAHDTVIKELMIWHRSGI